MQRRAWLKQLGLGGAALLGSATVLAETDNAVSDDGYMNELRKLTGSEEVIDDERVELHAPEDAANGAVVPVGVVSNLPSTTKIVLLVSNHSHIKVAELDTSNNKIAARLSTHLQLTKPAEITALVQSQNRWYANSVHVKKLGETCEL